MDRLFGIAVVALAAACACSPGKSDDAGETGGEEHSDLPSGEEESTETSDSIPDVPDEQCEDAAGVQIDLDNPAWEVLGTPGNLFRGEIISGQRAHLWAASATEQNPPTYELYELDLETGTVVSSHEHPRLGSLVLRTQPTGEAMVIQRNGYDIVVQQMSGDGAGFLTEMLDDHPRVGWDGGSSSIVLVDPRAEDFTFFGKSVGDNDPKGAPFQRLWRKRYEYGQSAPVEVDFVGAETEAENVGGGAWVDGDAVVGFENDIVRIGPDGSEVWRESVTAQRVLRYFGMRDGQLLWRYGTPTEINADGFVEGLLWLDPSPAPPTVTSVWEDTHCSHRFVTRAWLLNDGQEIVTWSGSSETGLLYVERIDATSGVQIATAQYDLDTSGSFSAAAFETEDGRIGVLHIGGNAESTHVRAYFPFDD